MEAELERKSWNPPRQCTATNNRGERCRRQPIPGGYVCVNHGGAIPAVQKSAKARLLAGADLAIDYLLKMLEPHEPCEHCGRSDFDRDPVIVKACQLVLDRAGYGPHATLEVTTTPADRVRHLTPDELVAKCEQMLATAIALRDASQTEVEEGVIIDDDESDAMVQSSSGVDHEEEK